VASIADGRPELLLGTVIDITAQKKARTRPCDSKDAKSVGTVPESEGARMADLSQKASDSAAVSAKPFSQVTFQKMIKQRSGSAFLRWNK
jgi:hypothetical protein